MCGLAGFIPKNNKKPNIKRLLALGVFNEDRGTDSCGIAIGDQVFKGTHTESKFRDFLMGNYSKLNFTESLPILIHTRKSTNGAHNAANAHPFVWHYKSKPDSSFVFMHNGVIHNEKELKNDYILKEAESMLTIDSHYLGLSLFYNRDINKQVEIFENYKGKAAVMYYDQSDDSVTVFKGAAGDIEERPLYYVETTEGYYFCSIDFALEMLFDKEVTAVKNNQLLKFKKGKIVEDIIVKREAPSYSTTTYYKVNTVISNPNTSVNNDVKWPLMSYSNLLYKYNNFLLEGAYKVWGDLDASSVSHAIMGADYKFYALESKYSNVYFSEGVACKDLAKLRQLYRYFNRKYGRVSRSTFEHNLIDYAKDTIIDLIPFTSKNGLIISVLYRDRATKEIQYYDRNDFELNTAIDVKFKFSNQEAELMAYGSGVNKALKFVPRS